MYLTKSLYIVALVQSFFKWAILSIFFVYFRLFGQTLQLLQQINVKKCTSSIVGFELTAFGTRVSPHNH